VAVIACAAALLLAVGAALAQAQQPAAAPAATTGDTPAAIPPEQLDSLVAPIALYPDPLLAQVLVASTYPLEIIQLQQWLAKNPGLEGDALADAVAKQPWDPSIQSMAAVPDAANRLADDIQWTTELGNAFLAQQADVMDAVQRMRSKAQDNGALESNEQQVVETTVVEEKTVIVVQSAQPEVIYVPSYSPTVVYGPPPVYYPYPPIYYPPYPAGGAFVAFSVGVAWGAAVWGGSCCGCGWGHNDININVDNNFNRVNNIQGGNSINSGNNTWQHNSQHRGGTPYADKATASKYGGSARGDPMSSRQASARPSSSQLQGGFGGSTGSASTANRAGSTGASNRSASAGPSTASRGTGGASASRGGDSIGNRSVPSSSSSMAGGFGGSASGFSGSSARSASSRGASSMRSMGSRGGGGRRR
jgi:hypothetical protein